MRETIADDARNTLAEIALAVLGQEEVEVDLDESFARYMEKRLDDLRLRRAEAFAAVEGAKYDLRLAEGALMLVDQQCDDEEEAVRDFLTRLKSRRLEIAAEKTEASRAAARAGYAHCRTELLAGTPA